MEMSSQLQAPAALPPGTHWIKGLVDPRTGLDDVEKKNFLTLPGLKLWTLGRPGRTQSLFLLFKYSGVQSILGPVLSALRPLLAYCTCPGWLWRWRSWWNERLWQEKPKYSEKTYPDATLTTTNPTCQTRAAAVGSQRLTASGMARPTQSLYRLRCFCSLSQLISK
jgi:hypothetical protein